MTDFATDPAYGLAAPRGGAGGDGKLDRQVSRVGDFVALLKPRVMSLVVFTGAVGLVLAPGHLHPALALIAVFCIAVSAGAAGAINMWYDRDIDSVMRRTAGRPIPAGRIDPSEALAFGAILSGGAVVVMGLALNWVAAALLAAATGFYVFIYTVWLKRRTPQNIVIGGASGAFPPMIGWAAVTGGIDVGSLALFALIFFWTPPHFWAMSLYASEDYRRAGVPMLPIVSGIKVTKQHILLYTLGMIPVVLLPYAAGVGGDFYAIIAMILTFVFIGYAVAVYRADDHDQGPARRMFRYSLFYLFLLFAVLSVDHGWTWLVFRLGQA